MSEQAAITGANVVQAPACVRTRERKELGKDVCSVAPGGDARTCDWKVSMPLTRGLMVGCFPLLHSLMNLNFHYARPTVLLFVTESMWGSQEYCKLLGKKK